MAEYGGRVNEVHAWSDSTITLAWLKSEPSQWPVFIANRVAQVQRALPGVEWKHMPLKCNPADQASRGVSPEVLLNDTLWWKGPTWLNQSHSTWSQQPSCYHIEENRDQDSQTMAIEEEDDFTIRFSSLGTLIRVVARCLRILFHRTPEEKERLKTQLAASELTRAYLACIRDVQRRKFRQETSALRRSHPVSRTSPLHKLTPFWDTSGIIRVGGRLHQAPLPYNQRHAAIVPKGCPLARLIIDRAHRAAMHGGNTLTYSYANRDTWIIGGRAQVRAYVRQCVVCARARVRPSAQLIRDLPPARVSVGRPFA